MRNLRCSARESNAAACRTRPSTMRAIAKRIQRLEGQLAPQADLAGHQALCILYARRRRRFEQERVPFGDLPPEPRPGPPRPLTPADVIRLRQAKRLARETD
jgi:hypothetical protein